MLVLKVKSDVWFWVESANSSNCVLLICAVAIAGVIIENISIAEYYADIFLYDWDIDFEEIEDNDNKTDIKNYQSSYENTIYILIIYTLTFGLIARDWRKRKWK